MLRLGFLTTAFLHEPPVVLRRPPYAQIFVRTVEQTRLFSSNAEDSGTATVVLLRHGQSTFNSLPTFTGWCDPPLTPRGVEEAMEAGALLKQRGFRQFDVAFTSTLSRAIKTLDLTLEEAGCLSSTPVEKAHQLNERHYGALQGKRKDDPELMEKYGKELVMHWRRDFKALPPPMDETHEYYEPPPAPLTESLEQCQHRVLEYWKEAIVPVLQPEKKILLVAHSNTIRALVAHLDKVPEEQVPNIHIPNSVPCVYRFCGERGTPVSTRLENAAGGTHGHWLFSYQNQERLRSKVGGTGVFLQSVFDAWDTNGDGVLSLQEIEAGLRQIMGGEDIAVSFIAAKILEEIDMDGSATLSPEEFREFGSSVYQKYMPGFMDSARGAP
ncbi:3-bisphosphoglycerate-dependent phosphoglycerate mutase [Seminavis robusta]|uniref:Phosphoglycerate mutase n=1 Tax=Seminavis robusta TaxID=568900 RepID=A0A9N8EE37_9STRA|nr:3-bisphosphoglycerate-dependent phosphoglycerate mutase [Seminavis robusta]|eukprot:Sro867_g213140.1 3-bisphosphoglycerate-dependent phosphoglycerate mutase (383) ;mRNA; f:7547-9071